MKEMTENDEIQMEVCCPSGKEIPQCDSESIEINDMIDLLLNSYVWLNRTKTIQQYLRKEGSLCYVTEMFRMLLVP
jgi:hypothetical protein